MSDDKDPAERAILVRCDVCGEDTGPVWCDPAYPLAPKVLHDNPGPGQHTWQWLERGFRR